jgi:hypothetical protein
MSAGKQPLVTCGNLTPNIGSAPGAKTQGVAVSDHFIVVVPRDPRLIPSDDVQRRVVEVLNRVAPNADEITAVGSTHIQFFDSGQNFEKVSCPRCSAEISIEWWQERMDDDHDGVGFQLHSYDTPCCSKAVRLNELIYFWPQAFGCFSWTVQNPNIGELTAEAISELEAAAGCSLVPIKQHL